MLSDPCTDCIGGGVPETLGEELSVDDPIEDAKVGGVPGELERRLGKTTRGYEPVTLREYKHSFFKDFFEALPNRGEGRDDSFWASTSITNYLYSRSKYSNVQTIYNPDLNIAMYKLFIIQIKYRNGEKCLIRFNNNNNNNNCLKSNIQCIEIRVQWTVHL